MSALRFEVLGAVNDPGKPGRTGDDRYGFDEAGGRAWVLDGATDVSPLRPFPRHESGAAWIAETLSAWLLAHPPEGRSREAYWTAALEAMREAARKDSKVPPENLPMDTSPIASGFHVALGEDKAEFNWLGDCMAMVRSGSGEVRVLGALSVSEEETADALRLNAMNEEDKWEDLRRQREAQNTPGHWIFGLDTTAAAHVSAETVSVAPGTEILLMSDGFYRLIDPFRAFTPETLLEAAGEHDLLALVRRLRDIEIAARDQGLRVKAHDDASCVHLRVV